MIADDLGVVQIELLPPQKVSRPPLKWAGGKRWLVPHLLPIWKAFSNRRLVEPFCGGLAMTLGLTPERALLSDRNPHLIRFYASLRRGFHISIRMEKILCTPTHRMMSSSRNIQRRHSRGRTRCERPNGWPNTKGRWFCRIRRPSESLRYMKSSGLSCDFWMRRGGSVATGTADRPGKCWRSEM